MTDIRISRKEIKGIAEQRENERADAADINESGTRACHDCDCESGACEWTDD
jgi:hypothetical protein